MKRLITVAVVGAALQAVPVRIVIRRYHDYELKHRDANRPRVRGTVEQLLVQDLRCVRKAAGADAGPEPPYSAIDSILAGGAFQLFQHIHDWSQVPRSGAQSTRDSPIAVPKALASRF